MHAPSWDKIRAWTKPCPAPVTRSDLVGQIILSIAASSVKKHIFRDVSQKRLLSLLVVISKQGLSTHFK